MEQEKQHGKSARRVSCGRIAAAAFALGGLSVSVFAVGTAGALSSRTARSVIVSTLTSAKFGKILVSGKTLYTLKPSKTACTAECEKIWPELVLPKGATKPKAGSGVKASKLGSVKRKGGIRQVTYAGKALYWFSGDTAAGQVNGNVTDVWGKWSVIVMSKPAHSSVPATSGATTTPAPSSTPGTSSNSGNSTPTTRATTPTTRATTPTTPPSTTMTPTTAPPSKPTPTTSPPPTTTPTTAPPPPTTTPTTSPGSGGGVGF